MNFDSHLQQLSDKTQELPFGLTPEDIAHLSNYPSIGQLFNGDASALKVMKNKLSTTFQNLERVVLRGSKEDAERAKSSAVAVKTTLEFLEMLEKLRDGKTNA